MRVPLFAAACVCALSAPDAFGGFGVIDDRSFFDGIPRTFLDFETRDDGSSLDLPLLGGELFSDTEYNNLGVNFQSNDSNSFGMGWNNIPLSPLRPFSQSLDAVGSAPIAISGGNNWTMTFTAPVHAVGIGVVQSGWAGPPIEKQHQTKMTAFDSEGNVLGEVFFWGDLVDGGFGGPFLGGDFGDEFVANPFGFLGIFSPDTPIATVQLTHSVGTGVIFDDLHFSALPAPGPGAALALTALGMGLLRRR